MELIDPTKTRTLDYKHGDVTLVVKAQANEDERMQEAFAGRKRGEPWSDEQKANYCRLLCRLMVVDWKGATHQGRPVDYDFELLKHLPQLPGKYLFLDLGAFIVKETDIKKGAAEEVKNA